MFGEHGIPDDDGAVHGVDSRACVPFGLEFRGIGEEIGIIGFHGPPARSRRTGTAHARIAVEPGGQLAARHHVGERLARRCVDDVRRQLELGDMLLVVDDPCDLRGIEATFINQNAPCPDAGRHRIRAYAHLSAFEVLRRADACIRADEQAGVMKAPHDEDRQGDKGGAIGSRDHISCRRKLADVKLDLPDHAPEGGDLRLDGHNVSIDAFD